MPENEFEKQVKELMEELHFSPSAPVWERIKKRISEKKRRVWPIFFLFISVATLGGYLFYADTNHHSQNINKNIETVKTPITKNLPNNISEEKSNKKDSAFKLQSQNLSTNKSNHESLVKNSKNDEPIVNQRSAINKINNDKSELAVKNLRDDKLVFNQSSTKETNTKEIVDTSKNALTKTQTSELNNNTNSDIKIIAQQQQPNSNNVFKDSITNADTDSLAKINNETKKNNSITKGKTQVKKIIKTNKWQFGIAAMYGRSNLTDKVTSLNNDKSLQVNPSLNNPGTTYGNYPTVLKNPYNANNAYKFGISLQRKISKRSSLNTGLNFVHLSSKSNTALNLDSSLVPVLDYIQSNNSASSFYRIGSAKTYINNFNFIEIPVTFQSSLFHINNLSVLYDGGISVMRLISSKALIYDNHTNNFFSNDALFRKTQFQLSAGLNLQLKIKNTGNLLLGPNFSYSLSPYLKNDNYSRLHFIDYGLHASWIFNKK
ncbi:MAG TPA: hypothetical protein VEV62_19855 [Parafilimonas sp.]|nr:hypothetical protein [Parafilimonas sp.]